jgi:hypothetical protein
VEFRIVSGDPSGFYGVSERLTAQDAVSLFLKIARSSFPYHLDGAVLDELTLREWADDPTPQLIYVGDRATWIVAIAPLGENEIQLPTAN